MNNVTHRLAKSTTPTPRVLKRIVWASFLLAGLLAAGTLGFLRFGGPDTDAFDAFYMTAITITTVGYSEVVDLSQTDAGRLFAAFVSFAGFGLVTFIFSSLTVFFLETDLNEALRRRRMENAIRKLRNHYIVCGFGRVGRNVATELQATNHHFVAIDENFDTIEQHTERFPALLYLHGDASDDDVLDRADIGDAKGIFAVTGDDSRNLMICLTAKQINPGIRVVAPAPTSGVRFEPGTSAWLNMKNPSQASAIVGSYSPTQLAPIAPRENPLRNTAPGSPPNCASVRARLVCQYASTLSCSPHP